MNTFSLQDIRSWDPCYDPARYLPEGWSGTALNILEDYPEIPIQDRFWVVLREEVLSPKLLRLFAVWCARQVQHLMRDGRSVAALDVAERYANGLATEEELKVARFESMSSVWSPWSTIGLVVGRPLLTAYESIMFFSSESASFSCSPSAAEAAKESSMYSVLSLTQPGTDAPFYASKIHKQQTAVRAVQLEILIKMIKESTE